MTNKYITTPVNIKIIPNQDSSNLNMAKAHRTIFSTTKLNDPKLKITTFQIIMIDVLLQLAEGNTYTTIFSDIISCSKTSRIYIYYKI